MRAGEHLDRFRLGAVAGDRAVVVPVGADQIGQQLGVGGIGLGARDVVAVAVAGHRQRVDRHTPDSRPRSAPPPTGRGRFRCRSPPGRVPQRVRRPARAARGCRSVPRVAAETASRRPASSIRYTSWWSSAQSSPMKIIDHRLSFGSRSTYFEPETPGGDLMDQCSRRHDIPSALQATHQPAGARSTVRNRSSLQVLKVLTGRRLGDQPASTSTQPRQRRADRFPLGSQIRRHILICRVMSMSFMTRISDDPMTPLAIADGTPRSISSD